MKTINLALGSILICCSYAFSDDMPLDKKTSATAVKENFRLAPERRGRIRSAEFLRAAANETEASAKAKLALEAVRENVDNTAAFSLLDGFLHGRELNFPDKLRIGVELLKIAAVHPDKGEFNLAVGYPLIALCGNKVPESDRVRANIIRFLLASETPSAALVDRQSTLPDMLGADLLERKAIAEGDKFFSGALEHSDPGFRAMAAPAAMRFYYAAAENASDNGLWLIYPSDRYRYQRKFDRALKIVEKSDAKLAPVKLEGRAALYVQCGLTDRADKLIDNAIAQAPADDLSVIYLKLTYLAGTKRIPEAIAFGTEMEKRHPDAVTFPSFLAELYLLRKQYKPAEMEARTAARLAPDSPNVRLTLVRVLTEKGDYKNALAELGKLAAPGPEEIFFKAHLLVLNRRGKDAVAELDKLAGQKDFNPNGEFFHQRLTAAGVVGDRKLVLRDYEELARRKELGNPVIANTVGYTFAVLDIRLQEAKKLVETALAAAPENYAYLDSMAWVLYRQKKFHEARRFIMLALRNAEKESDAPSAVLYEHAGTILFAAGDRSGAAEYLNKALAAPDDGEVDRKVVRDLLQKLEKSGKK